MFWVMIMKKTVCAALALCLILSACGEAAPAETQEPSEEVGSVVKVACVCAQPSVFGPTSLNGYEYQITHYDYGEQERYIADLTAGNAPDLVLFGTTPFVEYPGLDVNNEYYDDLYEYIDADDMLSRDSFLPNLLEAMSRDGELKFLCRQVTIASFVARRSAVGDGYGLLPSDYERIMAENPGYQSLFDTFVTKSSLLDSVCIISESAFTDRENASCDFDNDYFRSLLEFCNSSPYDEYVDGQSTYDFDNVLLKREYLKFSAQIQCHAWSIWRRAGLCRLPRRRYGMQLLHLRPRLRNTGAEQQQGGRLGLHKAHALCRGPEIRHGGAARHTRGLRAGSGGRRRFRGDAVQGPRAAGEDEIRGVGTRRRTQGDNNRQLSELFRRHSDAGRYGGHHSIPGERIYVGAIRLKAKARCTSSGLCFAS